MNILIIGNGFDLAHNLNTSYGNFLDYCKKRETNINNLESIDQYFLLYNLWLKHFITRQNNIGKNWINFEEEIYEVIKYISHIDPFTNLMQKTQIKAERISIQKDLSNFTFEQFCNNREEYSCKTKYNNKGYCTDISDIWFGIKYKTPKGLVNFLYDQLREFTEAFERYLNKEELPKLSNSQYKLSLLSRNQVKSDIYVLSFNYTDTCEKLYKIRNSCIAPKFKTFYVHGKLNSANGCNLVLGTKNFKNKEDGIPLEFNIFKKHNQRHKYGTIEDYQKLLAEFNSPQIKHPIFHVIGHSLDETDHAILKHIFNADKKAPIKIYYHDETVQDSLIDNITEIIEEEAVIARVRLIEQEDPQHGLLLTNKSELIPIEV